MRFAFPDIQNLLTSTVPDRLSNRSEVRIVSDGHYEDEHKIVKVAPK